MIELKQKLHGHRPKNKNGIITGNFSIYKIHNPLQNTKANNDQST